MKGGITNTDIDSLIANLYITNIIKTLLSYQTIQIKINHFYFIHIIKSKLFFISM